MSPLPASAYELVAAPAALGLAFLHARRTLGTARAAVELGALLVYGYALERIAIAVFSSHTYGPGWRVAPGGVPLAVAAGWAAVILAARAQAGRLGFASPLGRAGAAATFAITLDLLMEPVAMRAGLWTWTPPGPWLDVPVGNFVGWAVIVGVYAWGAEWGGDAAPPLVQLVRRGALAAVAVASLLAVGAVWTRVGAESFFGGVRGWLAWASLLVVAVGLARRRPTPIEASPLAGQGAAGLAPAGVFLAMAAPFAADAALLGDRGLGAAALGSLLVLAWISRATWAPRGVPLLNGVLTE